MMKQRGLLLLLVGVVCVVAAAWLVAEWAGVLAVVGVMLISIAVAESRRRRRERV
jgi:membrane-bound ClpP family serine protease